MTAELSESEMHCTEAHVLFWNVNITFWAGSGVVHFKCFGVQYVSVESVFLAPVMLSRFALAGCFPFSGDHKDCHRRGRLHWEETDCSCCQYSGLEDKARAEPRKWQQSMAKCPHTQTHMHTHWEEDGEAINTQANENAVSLSSSCSVACSHTISFSWLPHFSMQNKRNSDGML